MELEIAVLASGSRGNATWIGWGDQGVLVDCGISTRQVNLRMARAGLADRPIDAVVVSHEHRDHVAGAPVLARTLRRRQGSAPPFYMTEGTARALPPAVRPDGVVPVGAGQALSVGELRLHAFSISHDTADPVAWRVEAPGTEVVVVTDLGRPTTLVLEQLRRAQVAVMEFNHEMELLLTGRYPWQLKQRIRGSHGHLSNDQAVDALVRAAPTALSHLVLAHLSQDNNRPVHAERAARRALRSLDLEGQVRVAVGSQDQPLEVIRRRLA